MCIQKCIYSLNTEQCASFKKREHIIPAGLGGKQTLGLGFVSDSVNELFSKRELIALRHTILAINRRNNGPGKRGSSNVIKIKNPIINVYKYTKDGTESNYDIQYAPYRLGFCFYGKLYTIPQIIFPIRKDYSIKIPRILLGNSESKENEDFCNFIFSLHKNDSEIKFIKIESDLSFDEDFIVIGMFNKKIFIFTTKEDDYIKLFISLIKQKNLPQDIVGFTPTNGEYYHRNEEKLFFDDSYVFIYVKTAFNVLAFMQGQQFALGDEFHFLRKSLISNTGLNGFTSFSKPPEWLIGWIKEALPLKAHYTAISAKNNSLTAYVGFYGETPVTINLSNQYVGEDFKKIFVCDYLNSREYLKILDV